MIEDATQAELDECPFCAGREDRTPPEVFRVGHDAAWTVRVVPNLYPAFERQEVVVHSPRHVRTFAELADDEVAAVAEAWEARRAQSGYMHACINEGRAAGSSLPHSHSQLVWLEAPPPEVARERPDAVRELTLRHDLIVARRGPLLALVHPFGRLPYETLITTSDGVVELAPALDLLRELVRRLRAVEGPVPWNAWLHPGHLEVVPRLNVLAGVELGAGIYVNTVSPEDAAAALRSAG